MSSASFVGIDTATQGGWVTAGFGGLGYAFPTGYSSSLPSGVTLNANGAATFDWNSGGGGGAESPQDPSNPSGSRKSPTWYDATALVIDLSLPSPMRVRAYMLDYDNTPRNQDVTIRDGSGSPDLDGPRNVTSFSGGKYYTWDLDGDVELVAIPAGGTNAVVSFFTFDSIPGGGGSSVPVFLNHYRQMGHL